MTRTYVYTVPASITVDIEAASATEADALIREWQADRASCEYFAEVYHEPETEGEAFAGSCLVNVETTEPARPADEAGGRPPLMRAAGDLLAACEAVDWLLGPAVDDVLTMSGADAFQVVCDLMPTIRAAIAKARGNGGEA